MSCFTVFRLEGSVLQELFIRGRRRGVEAGDGQRGG